MSQAGTFDFQEYQGDTWDTSWVIEDNGVARNLTGYSARMYLKEDVVDPDPPVFSLNSTSNNRLVITAGTGTITMAVTPAESDAIAAGTYVYDFELVDGSGKVKKYMKGNFVIVAQVTTGT